MVIRYDKISGKDYIKSLPDPIRIKLLSTMYEGGLCTLEINGKIVNRRVYYRKDCGLFIRHNNRAYFDYELTFGEEVIL